MSNLLTGKKGIIFGALDEQSIAWKVAERAAEEGAQFVLTLPRLELGEIASVAILAGAP